MSLAFQVGSHECAYPICDEVRLEIEREVFAALGFDNEHAGPR